MAMLHAIRQPPARRPIPRRPPVARRDVVAWGLFAIAAAIFMLDAPLTVHVLAVEPSAVEQNPIARWALAGHPATPFVLKASIVTGCVAVVRLAHRLDERWAGTTVTLLMAVAGSIGIASALVALRS